MVYNLLYLAIVAVLAIILIIVLVNLLGVALVLNGVGVGFDWIEEMVMHFSLLPLFNSLR